MSGITISLVVLCLMIIFAVMLAVIAVLEADSDKQVGVAILFIAILVLSGVRYSIINDDIRETALKELCIKEGKQAIEIFDKKVCKL